MQQRRATDARVPPRWILDRHPHHEVGHLAWRDRPASTSAGAAVVLPGDQPPVPAENRVGCDDAGDLRQHPPAEFLASHRESTALGVGQAKWTWATLLPEDPILLPEIIDHVFLVAVHPASGREYEEAQSVGHSLRLLGKQPLALTLFRRFANLGRFVAPYEILFNVRTRLYQAELDPAVAEEADQSCLLSPAQDPRKVRELILAAIKRDDRDSDRPCTWQVCRE